MQKDLKRLVAYASIVDVAFIVLGTFAFSAQGVTGGVLEMVNHGLTTGAIFFLVGIIWERRGTLRISELGGLQKSTPILAAIFLVVVMSAVGLPGLNGFVGEFLVLVGTFITHRWWAVVATTAIISGAIYLLWAYQRVFHGPIRIEANAAVRDISWREIGAVAPLLAGIVFLGIYPKPVPRPGHPVGEPSAGPRADGRPVGPRASVRATPLSYSVPADQNVDGRARRPRLLARAGAASTGRVPPVAAVGAGQVGGAGGGARAGDAWGLGARGHLRRDEPLRRSLAGRGPRRLPPCAATTSPAAAAHGRATVPAVRGTVHDHGPRSRPVPAPASAGPSGPDLDRIHRVLHRPRWRPGDGASARPTTACAFPSPTAASCRS